MISNCYGNKVITNIEAISLVVIFNFPNNLINLQKEKNIITKEKIKELGI